MNRSGLKYLFALFCLISPTISYSQYSINGKVYDENTGEPLSPVNITISKANKVTATNSEGSFIIENIPSGKYTLTASFVGYLTYSISVDLNADTKAVNFPLKKDIQNISAVSVTANRTPKKIENTASRVDIISEKELNSYPSSNLDDLLQSVPNVYVNRSWGIFSKNSTLTMRGMDGYARVLVLFDGVPLNRTSGGGINWHMIPVNQIEKIEVIKGPASALYGNNAMGGVINIISKRSKEKLSGELSMFGGSYGTVGGRINLGGNYTQNQKGFFWSLNSFYRRGDGYIITPEEDRDFTDVPLFLKEYGANLTVGYQFNDKNKLEISTQLYDDRRGEGQKVYEEDGSYLKYSTLHTRASYTTNIKGFDIYVNSFYHKQRYYQHAERLNQTGDTYKLYDREQDSEDYGVWINSEKKLFKNDILSFGADYKHGSLYAEDIYMTSTDFFERQGAIDFFAVFLQNELQLLNNKLIITAGIRLDYSGFKDAELTIEDPTSVTAFETNAKESFQNTSWFKISPKVALKFKFSDMLHAYTSYSVGFMPPKLDDMCSSRKISNGFKLANPDLKPEKIDNFELGADFFFTEKLKLNTSVYYSIGRDFQYFAGTGDTVDVDRAVVKRENISKVNIVGTETGITFKAFKFLNLKANYTYNRSVIKKFDLEGYTGTDLEGMIISETPPHQAYFGAFFTSKIVNVNIIANYISGMWQDELNTLKIEPYTKIDIRIQKRIFKNHLNLVLDIQNIIGKQHIDKKGGLSPGRFIMGEIGFFF